MKIERKDLAPLRLPIAAFIASLVLSFLLIDYSGERRSIESERMRAASAQADEARKRYQDSDIEKEIIARYLPQYRELERRGFIGSENRIKWIDALRIADQQTGSFGVQYQLSAQGPYKGLLSDDPIASHLRRSTMDIRFGAVHEGQFLAFLAALEAQDAGMYALRSCSLQPVHRDIPQPRTRNLSAQCEIDWLTLVPPGAQES
ncbi:MAG TPA: hypothetical protein VMW70_01130 [Burkholderiales bacterium]|nr:hypothetical protein [Burkholderiales bacterium]